MRQWHQCFYTLLILFSGCTFSLSLQAEEFVQIPTRDGVTQSFLFSSVEQPRASVILFPGGGGYMKLREEGSIGQGKNNFLVRSREFFSSANFNVVVFEAPSDHQTRRGMKGGFRATEEHAEDIAAVVAYLRHKASVPVWLVGTSRGTESVANAAVRKTSLVDGVVLTASMSEKNNNGVALPEMSLNKVSVPVFIATHENDACWVTPTQGSEVIKHALVNAKQVELKSYRGGFEAESDACKGLSAHGFYGIEEEVIRDINNFIQQVH